MNFRNITALLILVGFLSVLSAEAVELNWVTSYEKALKTATSEGTIIVANFTGSDWCPWCFKIRDEIFNTAEFKKWSSENAVLLELDFPRKKALPADLKAQNEKLARKYQIQGFPTILLLDGKGEILGKSGYMKGGPKPWIENAKKVIMDAKTLVAGSLSEAVTEGKRTGRPVLAISVEKGNAESGKLYKKLIQNADINALSKTALIAVRIETPVSDGGDSDIASQLKLPGSGINAVLFNPVDLSILLSEKVSSSISGLLSSVRAKLPAPSYTGGWTEDYAEARYASAVTGKALFLDFTGSDWCGWCMKLDNEIFGKNEFKAYAKENLILVKLDFPKKKELPKELQAQNRALAIKYGIQGFPTLIILDPSGKKIGQAGYMKGGPEPFINHLKTIVK